jgi:hypothetical protein
MFEEEITPCDGEKKVKVWHVGHMRSKFLQIKVAESVLMVTTQRVIFRSKGILNNRNFVHGESPIEDVSGVHLKTGFHVDFFHLLIILLFPAFLFGMQMLTKSFLMFFIPIREISTVANVLILLFIIYWLYRYITTLIKLNTISEIRPMPLAVVIEILKIIWGFLCFVKPSFKLLVASKGGSQGAIDITPPTHTLILDVSASQRANKSAHDMIKEIGSIVNDIKLGKYVG